MIDEFHAKKGLGVGPFGDNLLLMTATGAMSGQEITTPLVYRHRGNQYVVVASKGGAPEDPSWYRNIQRHPVVDVELASDGGTEHFSARARALGSGAERDQLFDWMSEVWPAFKEYQQRAPRTIPIVVLERL